MYLMRSNTSPHITGRLLFFLTNTYTQKTLSLHQTERNLTKTQIFTSSWLDNLIGGQLYSQWFGDRQNERELLNLREASVLLNGNQLKLGLSAIRVGTCELCWGCFWISINHKTFFSTSADNLRVQDENSDNEQIGADLRSLVCPHPVPVGGMWMWMMYLCVLFLSICHTIRRRRVLFWAGRVKRHLCCNY